MTKRELLVSHVQELEHLEARKRVAAENYRAGLAEAKADGFDATTLKVVLKLRKMTPSQRSERRALEAIYMAALGMLEGEALPEEARRRLDPAPKNDPPTDPPAPPASTGTPPDDREEERSDRRDGDDDDDETFNPPASKPPEQPPLIVKDPEEARQEGGIAAAGGKRIYDNPYRAGDPCRAAWDEGWCAQSKSNGMETPSAFQRRTAKPEKPAKDETSNPPGAGTGAAEAGGPA
jgi:uncharacterized protein (UPF0335 family)